MAERLLVLSGACLLLLVPAIATVSHAPDLVSLGTQAVIFGLAAASLDLLIGYAGLVSFGHAAFFGLGAYATAIMASDGIATSAAVAWPVAVAIAALAALVIGAMSLRTTGLQFIMITLAFAEMLFFFFVSWKTYGGDDGLAFRRRDALPGIDPRDDVAFYYVSVAALAVFLALGRMVLRARFGMAVQGIRQNIRRARAVGMPPYRYQLAVFTLAGAGAGLAGVLAANQLRFVSPDMLHWTTSGELMVMVVLGGTGSLYGPVLGAWIFVLLQSFLGRLTDHWMIVLGPILILVVIFAPKGLWGSLKGRARPVPPARIARSTPTV